MYRNKCLVGGFILSWNAMYWHKLYGRADLTRTFISYTDIVNVRQWAMSGFYQRTLYINVLYSFIVKCALFYYVLSKGLKANDFSSMKTWSQYLCSFPDRTWIKLQSFIAVIAVIACVGLMSCLWSEPTGDTHSKDLHLLYYRYGLCVNAWKCQCVLRPF